MFRRTRIAGVGFGEQIRRVFRFRLSVRALAICWALGALAARPGGAQEPRLFFEQDGEGIPVVFVSAWAHDTSVWFRILPPLRDGRRLVRYDLRGQGRSEGSVEGDYSLEAHRRDLVRLLDGLGIERAHFVGAGLGGTIALSFAAAHPERTRSLTLVEPHIRWSATGLEWWNRFLAAYERVGRPDLGAYTSVLVDRWVGTDFATRDPWVEAFFDLVLRRQAAPPLVASLLSWLSIEVPIPPASGIPVATLIVRGERNEGEAWDRDVLEVFPRARKVRLKSRRTPHVEAPRELARVIDDFLKSVDEWEKPR